MERKLYLFDAHRTDYEAPKDSVYWGKFYSRFKDDIGNFWRSYDGNKTFISESNLRKRGWNIGW